MIDLKTCTLEQFYDHIDTRFRKIESRLFINHFQCGWCGKSVTSDEMQNHSCYKDALSQISNYDSSPPNTAEVYQCPKCKVLMNPFYSCPTCYPNDNKES